MHSGILDGLSALTHTTRGPDSTVNLNVHITVLGVEVEDAEEVTPVA